MVMNYYSNISITSVYRGLTECLSITCDHIFVHDQTAFLSFRKRAHLDPSDIRLAEVTQTFLNTIAQTDFLEIVVIDPNLSQEPIAGRLTNVKTIHLSLLMALDSSELLSADSLSKQHWLGLVDSIASNCKKIFPQCDVKQSTFKFHTLDNQLYSCTDVFSKKESNHSFTVIHERSIT